MKRRTIIGLVVGGIALVGGGGGIAVAATGGGGGETEAAVTGPDADRAIAAAMASTRGGKAGAVERDGENGATYEVEVTKPDGTTVDVRLNDAFGVVSNAADIESTAGEEGNEQGPEVGEAPDAAPAPSTP